MCSIYFCRMDVTVHSTLSSAPGQVSVVAEPDQHVDSLVVAFCVERGIQVGTCSELLEQK